MFAGIKTEAGLLVREVVLGLAFLVAYVILEYLSSIGLYRSLGVTPWSPGAGLAVALAYLASGPVVSVVVFAPVISDAFLNVGGASSIYHSLAMFAVGVIYLATGLVLRRWSDLDLDLRTVRDCLILIAAASLCAFAVALVTVTVLAVLAQITNAAVLPIGWRAFVGTLVGVLTVTPLVFLILLTRNWPAFGVEQLAQVAAVAVIAYIIFRVTDASAYQFFYLLFLPVLWIVLRRGNIGAIFAANLVQVAIIVGSQTLGDGSHGLAPLQTLLVALVITSMLAGAVVTEREANGRRLREQQAALNRALRLSSAGETVAAVAHELNQPLTALSTYAGITSSALERGDLSLARETLEKLRREVNRAAQVVSTTRALVRYGHLATECVVLQDLLRGVVQLFGDEVSDRKVSLVVDVPRNQRHVWLDRTQVTQALYNLINNSLEAISETGRAGQIRLSAQMEPGGALVMEVSDDGPGFPQGFDELASTPFLTTKRHGSGLGLAVARSVAEAHGGSLTIVPFSAGAVVRLKFPKTTEATCPSLSQS